MHDRLLPRIYQRVAGHHPHSQHTPCVRRDTRYWYPLSDSLVPLSVSPVRVSHALESTLQCGFTLVPVITLVLITQPLLIGLLIRLDQAVAYDVSYLSVLLPCATAVLQPCYSRATASYTREILTILPS
eukprot:jgi/Chrzof1/64/Cz01g02090.t1